uniref:Retinol dehydrogenase 8 n=1 Tax=Gopherus evgoodei TaxID=1825980 RepID=A0A8C4VV41_9SAUR
QGGESDPLNSRRSSSCIAAPSTPVLPAPSPAASLGSVQLQQAPVPAARLLCVIVIATMRNLGKRGCLEAAAGITLNKTLEIRQLDVCDEAPWQCYSACPYLAVNNAGVGMIGPIECQTIEEMKGVMETNFFGVVRMIKEVLPDMKRRRSGHIVVISSVMGLQGIMFNDIYTASKFAVEGFCESLVIQALKFNIFVSLIEPGPVVTEFETKVYEDAENADYSTTDPETADMFTNLYLKNSKAIFSSLGQTPNDIAEVKDSQPPFRHQTNAVYTPMTALKHADPTGALMTDTFYKMRFSGHVPTEPDTNPIWLHFIGCPLHKLYPKEQGEGEMKRQWLLVGGRGCT